MSKPFHQVLELISLIPEVIIDADEWSLDQLTEIANVANVSRTKVILKNAKKLNYSELKQVLKIKDSTAENVNIVLEL